MECVSTIYQKILNDTEAFSLAMDVFINTQAMSNSLHSKYKPCVPSIVGLLTLIDIVFDMFRDVGLHVVYEVFEAIKCHPTIEFEKAKGWKLCCFSKLPSPECLQVGHKTVHVRYMKLLQCLWLTTNICELERTRRSIVSHRVPTTRPSLHYELYRRSFCFVLRELERLYEDVVTQEKATSTRRWTMKNT